MLSSSTAQASEDAMTSPLRLRPYNDALDAETEEFYDGIVDLFTGYRAGHLGRYCFSSARNAADKVRGDEHWTQFIKTTNNYYPYHHQIEIIRDAADQIGKAISDASTWVDLGTGSLNSFERKVLPIIRSGKFNEIVFVDLCTTFSKIASSKLEQENLQIESKTFIGNFFEKLPLLTNKAVINLFGITLGNIIVDLPQETPEEILAQTMRHFAAPLLEHGGYFVFDYDTNTNEGSMHSSYDHPSYHAMEMSILERAKRDLPSINFDPENFEHITTWHPQWGLLAQELRAKIDMQFTIGPYKIDLSKGQSFRTGSSFKYSDEAIECAANKAGFKKLNLFTLPESTMRVAIYKIA